MLLHLVLLGSLAMGADPAKAVDPIDESLRREIVGGALPLAEVQQFLQPRIAELKPPLTAEQWSAEAESLRQALFDKVIFRGEASAWRHLPLKVEWLDTLAGGPGYSIRRLRYQAAPGMWIPALLYLPDTIEGQAPVVLNVNGHVGKPGKAVEYKQLRCINLAKRGCIALNVEWIGMGQLGTPGFLHAKMNQLDLCGTSGLAPFYLSMQRGIDLLLSLPKADPARVVVTGLSGGGWQTIFISALDKRVLLAAPVAGYSSFVTRLTHLKDLGDSEQTPCDMATVADYTHLTAMRAPRPTLLIYNSKDNCCFESSYALSPLVAAAHPAFALFGKANCLTTHVNDDPGTHNYELDNRQAFYRAMGRFVMTDRAGYLGDEIPSSEEVKTPAQLEVPLPANNADFNSLSLALAKNLPKCKAVTAADRPHLRALVRFEASQCRALAGARGEVGGVVTTEYRLRVADRWTVPALLLTPPDAKHTALLLADAGRKSAGREVRDLLARGYRVLAIDPFHVGESTPPRSPLFALFVAAVGRRPLGIQASQIVAIAKWLEGEAGQQVELVALGPRMSVAATVAAACEPSAVAALELHRPLASFKDLLDRNWGVGDAPECFCFGLFESFDLPQLLTMADAHAAGRLRVTVAH